MNIWGGKEKERKKRGGEAEESTCMYKSEQINSLASVTVVYYIFLP